MISSFRQNIEYMKACRRGENLLPSVDEAIDAQLAESAKNVQQLLNRLRLEGFKEVDELKTLAHEFSKIDPSHAALPLLQQIIDSCAGLKFLQEMKLKEVDQKNLYVSQLTQAIQENQRKIDLLTQELASISPISPHEAFVVEAGKRISERNHAPRGQQPNYRR